MPYYYNYKFTDTKKLYARIKEELSSYFEAGLLDDTMMDIYVQDCLDMLGKGTHKITQTVLKVKDHEVELPDDLFDIREVWACTVEGFDYTLPSATYVAKMKETAHKLWEDVDVRCHPCDSCKNPNKIEATYKVTNTVLYQWERTHLLTRQPIHDLNHCHKRDIYDVQGCKLITPLETAHLNVLYYATAQEGDSDLAIPDNIRILRYMEEYIKYKLFYKLFNIVSDESINIVERKMTYHQQRSDEAFVSARIETMKWTKEQIINNINKIDRSLDKYEIPRQYHRRARY
jgi:hypothetical protein